MKTVVLTLILFSLIHAGNLTVNISGVRPERGGSILLFLYDNENWLEVNSATVTVPVSAGVTEYSVVLGNMVNRNYAVRVVHDENSDGRLTMRAFPPAPVEGYGFSAGYKPGGVPEYEKAEFFYSGESKMGIDMSYP